MHWLICLCLFACVIESSYALSIEHGVSVSDTLAKKSTASVVSAIVKAYGGMDMLSKFNSAAYKSHAKVSESASLSGATNSFDCDILGKGDKVRIETTVIGQKTTLGFDGVHCWTKTGDWVYPSSETQAKEIAEELKHSLSQLTTLTNPKCKVEFEGTKPVLGRDCDVLKAVAEDGKPTTFYADQQTHLILRSEFMGTDREQSVPALQATEYQDYRPVGGTQMAYATTDYVGGKRIQTNTVETFQFDVPVDDSAFAMPPETFVEGIKDKPIVIPFDYVHNKIIIKLRLNRSVDGRFIVDTGASQSVLDKSTAGTLGTIAASDFSITTGGKALNLGYMTVPTVTVGDISMDNITFLVSDLSGLKATVGEQPMGLIGANILRRFLVSIDFKDKEIVLSDPRSVNVPAGAAAVKTSPIFGDTALVVEAKLNHSPKVNFLVDLGASFNSLPHDTAKRLYGGTLLPVGQIAGLDNKRIDIGSIKLDNLELADLTIDRPVFAVNSEQGDPERSGGVFSAGSMGILGAPFWSLFTLTIDYRNERLILERIPEDAAIDSYKSKCDQIHLSYLRTRSLAPTIASYQKLIGEAAGENSDAGQAVVKTALASDYTEAFVITKSSQYYQLALSSLADAAFTADKARNKTLRARALALCAYLHLLDTSDPAQPATAQHLLAQATQASSFEPSVRAITACLFFRLGQLDQANAFADQSLLFDPSNWQALWCKYRIAQKQSNASIQSLAATQLAHYYSGVPEVVALGEQAKASTK